VVQVGHQIQYIGDWETAVVAVGPYQGLEACRSRLKAGLSHDGDQTDQFQMHCHEKQDRRTHQQAHHDEKRLETHHLRRQWHGHDRDDELLRTCCVTDDWVVLETVK
jgi:hypothetical protein